jgi:hypothetical protein
MKKIEARHVEEIDDGLDEVAAVNFDPNVRDWVKPKPKPLAEILVIEKTDEEYEKDSGHLDMVTRQITYGTKKNEEDEEYKNRYKVDEKE